MQEINPLKICFSLRLDSNNVGANVQVDIGGTTSVGNTQVLVNIHTIFLEISCHTIFWKGTGIVIINYSPFVFRMSDPLYSSLGF